MSKEAIQYLSVDQLECEPQVRQHVTDESVMGLARSIQETKRRVLQPISVRQDGARLVVVDGERRLRAARLAKLKEIAVMVEDEPLSDGEVLQRQLIANMQRCELTPCEKGRGIRRLMELRNWSLSEAAGKIGASVASASRLVALDSLPEEIRRQVDEGKIPASAAYQLSRVPHASKQAELAQQLAEGKLTRDAVSGAVKAARKGKAATTADVKRVTVPLGEGRSVTVIGVGTMAALIDVLNELVALAQEEQARGTELKQFARSRKGSAGKRAA